VSVQPSGLSSLIFVVIIGVWAAYFIQYWVRRREHLATARSVDQFSESIRVLERRNPLPATDLSQPRRESYAVAPARPARPQILVKRAATTPPAVTEPVEAASSGPRATAPARDDARVARRNRGLVMMGALSTAVVAIPLVALSLLPPFALLVPVVCVGGSLAWVRRSVQAELRARRADSRPVRTRPARPESVAQPLVADAPVADSPASVADSAPEAAPEPARGDVLFDVQAADAAARGARPVPAEPVAPVAEQPVATQLLVDEDDIPLTWDPVPVPRPTYTMKARVTRPAPTSADLVGDADTEYAAQEDELPARRVAGA
jgi:cytoskeletal protein RodZ